MTRREGGGALHQGHSQYLLMVRILLQFQLSELESLEDRPFVPTSFFELRSVPSIAFILKCESLELVQHQHLLEDKIDSSMLTKLKLNYCL